MRKQTMTGIVALIAALALTGCTPTGTGAGPETVSATPTPTSSTTPSVEPTSPQPSYTVVPADCGTIATMPQVAVLIAGMMDIGAPDVPVMNGAQMIVGCGWMVGDATGGTITISQVDVPTAQQAFEGINDSGGTCDAYRDGSRCVVVGTRTDYPVDTYDVTYFRDDLWIELNSSNIDFGPALDDLIDSIWG